MTNFSTKLTFITGLKKIVLDEIKTYPELRIAEKREDSIYLEGASSLKAICNLKSITNVYLTKRGDKLNPYFISKHKSILNEIIETVLKENIGVFHTFKLSCAGSNSKEVEEIKGFIADTHKMTYAEDADMEMFIGKQDNLWEIGVRLTSRPLSLRKYKIKNIKGGLNPTIAYAMNSFCHLDSIESYLNIFSGSGTLLIEAGLFNPKIKLMGFDVDGKSNALAIQNIKKAGLLKSTQLKTADIFRKPDLGKFDVITSDLPFGMQISKYEDLEKLYKSFVMYCEEFLNSNGILVVCTTEIKLFETILKNSKFMATKILKLKIMAASNSCIYPEIFVCKKIK